MAVPLGAIAPPRPRRRGRDVELAGVGAVSLVTSMVVASVQTRWVADWSAEPARGAGTLVLLLPPFGLWLFGLVLVVVGWRRRPFRGMWRTELPVDHVRRALLFGGLVLAVVGLAVIVRLGVEIVDVVERSAG